MILQYCSDLHLEFPANKDYIKTNPIRPIGDILILAGDITLFNHIDRQKISLIISATTSKKHIGFREIMNTIKAIFQTGQVHLKRKSELT